VFYLHEPITCMAGEVIEGVLKCTPNEKNPRDLDIDIEVHFEGASNSLHDTHKYRLR